MYVEINDGFAAISRKLFRHSLNYCADYRLYVAAQMNTETLEMIVTKLLGNNAVVGGSVVATKQDVLDELRDSLRYRGDHGSHPSLDYLDSIDSATDFDAIVSSIQEILDESIGIESFWLKEGHPFCPVFWELAFLIRTHGESILLIGSSSD